MGLNFGQNLFPPRGELIISYDYIDTINGTGYDIFYGFNQNGTLGTSTIPNVYSGIRHINGSEVDIAGDNAYDQMTDINFDILFNTSRNIKGDILVMSAFGMKNTEDGANTAAEVYCKCEVLAYHYDGSTETQIGSTATSEEFYNHSMSQDEVASHITTFKINASSTVHFKAGDILRFTFKVFIKHNSGGANLREFIGGLGCDPINRTDITFNSELTPEPMANEQIITTDEPTQLAFHVPFKLDI